MSTIVCPECRGSGRVTCVCAKCDNRHQDVCEECDGEGEITADEDEEEKGAT